MAAGMRGLSHLTRIICLTAVMAMAAGCADKVAPDARPWRAFVEDLIDVESLSRLDVPGTKFLSSSDPSGGNDDFNNFAGPGSEAGWVVLADLKGPGCVRRFWTTGCDQGHQYRMFFDGERKPRISGKVEELFGSTSPFVPPLSSYMNLCWVSYVPLTFQKSLRIETQAPNIHPFWGPRRIFFQMNVEQYGDARKVQTFPKTLSESDKAALETVSQRLVESVEPPVIDLADAHSTQIEPGSVQTVFEAREPGIISELLVDVQPASSNGWTMQQREFLLQDTLLRVFYGDATAPSISVPVGDFFQNPWRRRHYGSLLLGSGENGFRSAMPMPFAKSIRIEVLNGADRAVDFRIAALVKPLDDKDRGYLHAQWSQSGVERGPAHPVADFKGAGKFVGCFLALTGLDDSWWILEGDEAAWIDGETRPSWVGTGLEDYFNGGWYYRGCAFSAFHGIFDRAPFRTAQYRHQLVDPVTFSSSFRMSWERGDQNVSRGQFKTVAYAYLRSPSPVHPCPADRSVRRPIENRLERQTFMVQLMELERMNNFRKALDYIVEYVERHPGAEENGVYLLRALEYRRLLGEAVADSEYEPFVAGEHGAAAAEQAKLLRWFHEKPNRALVGLNANAQATLFINDHRIIAGDNPYQLFVRGVELQDGPNSLCVKATWQRQEPWIQAAVRTHRGVTGTGPGLTFVTREPGPNWQSEPLNEKWLGIPHSEVPRGVPDAPFIGGVPNAFILMQSKTYPVRAPDWTYHRDTACFRTDFLSPLEGWPRLSRMLIGVSR